MVAHWKKEVSLRPSHWRHSRANSTTSASKLQPAHFPPAPIHFGLTMKQRLLIVAIGRAILRLKYLAPLVAAIWLSCGYLAAADKGTLIFQDDFQRSESQEITDEPGNGWGTNSKSRAKGHKQVDLRDGAMYIYTHAEADHAASITHPAEFQNGTVQMRFMLEDERDSLGLNFADPQCQEVHAGHLFAARISLKDVTLQDLKTGNMRLDIREVRQAKQPLNAEQQAALQGKNQTTPHQLTVGKWYEVVATIQDDRLSVSIDGKPIASLASPGIAHPTKRLLRLAVPRNAVVDDVRIWKE